MYNLSNSNFLWKNEDLISVLPIILTLTFFVLYWFTANSSRVKKYYYSKFSFNVAAYKHIFFTKLFGFFSMGIVPIIICLLLIENYTLSDYGLTFISETAIFSVLWTLGLSIIVVPLVYHSAKKSKNLVNYPQIRAKVWSKKIMIINALGWFLYLFGYEFLFRGVLLFPLVESLGVWPAITINIALYSATHIPKGLDETIGAIPLGFILCLLTIHSGTIWIAFFVHVIMAWTNTFTALHYNPDIKIE